MKFLLVFVFAVFCLINHVVTRKSPKPDICTSDKDCGQFCFCIKQLDHHRGQCECTMDPYYFKICHNDYDCIDHSRGICECVKIGSEAGGSCSCAPPLLG